MGAGFGVRVQAFMEGVNIAAGMRTIYSTRHGGSETAGGCAHKKSRNGHPTLIYPKEMLGLHRCPRGLSRLRSLQSWQGGRYVHLQRSISRPPPPRLFVAPNEGRS